MALLPGIHLQQIAFYILFTLLYPLSKRYTYTAPFYIGMIVAPGVIFGSSVMGVDIFAIRSRGAVNDPLDNTSAAIVCLWMASALWITIIELLQDFQGLDNDLRSGVLSLAVAHRHDAKPIFLSIAMTQVGLLYMMGALIGAGPLFYLGVCGGLSLLLAWMLWRVNLDDPESCAWWVRHGH